LIFGFLIIAFSKGKIKTGLPVCLDGPGNSGHNPSMDHPLLLVMILFLAGDALVQVWINLLNLRGRPPEVRHVILCDNRRGQ
jgi:hypothetical protein